MSALMLFHGFMGAPSCWDNVLALLSERSALSGVQVSRPLLPGHGRPAAHLQVFNEGNLDRGSTPLEAAADVFVNMIPNGDRALVAGYSMGARLALAIAARHPSRVAGLVLVSVHPGIPDGSSRDERRRWDDIQARRLRDEGLVRFVDAWERMPLFESQRALPHTILATQRRTRLAHDGDSLALAMSALGLGRQPDFSAGIKCPAVFLAGALDAKFVALHSQLAARSPGATCRTVGGAGHNLPLEAPVAIADSIEQMLHGADAHRCSKSHQSVSMEARS